jgi:hypothetical protein
VFTSANGFVKTGGTIYGYDSNYPDDPYSNAVKNSSGTILTYKGNAVSVGTFNTSPYGTVTLTLLYRKETTLGPELILRYKYPGDADISGWD